jgi:hypothetical protein
MLLLPLPLPPLLLLHKFDTTFAFAAAAVDALATGDFPPKDACALCCCCYRSLLSHLLPLFDSVPAAA